MATDRLYYSQQTLQSFDATVLRTEERGDDVAVWLDRTAFYPTSGGQPHDRGTLGGLAIVAVEDDEAGDVVHVVRGGALASGSVVHGDIDWRRRHDHMQQHTGQHLLSAVIEHAHGAKTTSFHLGTDSSTIDIDRELTPSQLAEIERAANRVIWDDVAVSVRTVSEDEAKSLPLRKESARTGALRLVNITGVDLSACGGTHVERTGGIGQLVLEGWDRFKGGQRLSFLCGARALVRFQQLRDTSAASIRLLSVLPADLPSAIERFQGDLKAQARTIATLQSELAVHQARALVDSAESTAAAAFVLRAVDGDVAQLKMLASAVVATPGVMAVLVSRSTPALAIAARGSDVTAVSCQDVIGAVAKQFGGRGGGRPDLAQCGNLQASADDILAFVRSALSSAGLPARPA